MPTLIAGIQPIAVPPFTKQREKIGGKRVFASLDGSCLLKETSSEITTAQQRMKSAKTCRKINTKLKNTLTRLNMPDVVARVAICGEYMVVYCPKCGKGEKIKAFCHHKLCGRCQKILRYKKIEQYWTLVKGMKHPRFLTLTFKNVHYINKNMIKWQKACFRKFQDDSYVRARLGGGIASWECLRVTEKRAKVRTWNPHIHIMYDGQYMRQSELVRIWRDITGNSFIVDIREIMPKNLIARWKRHPNERRVPTENEKRECLKETLKYITKSIAFSDSDVLVGEFLSATHGMRRIWTFGSAYNYKKTEPKKTDKRFWAVDPLTRIGWKQMSCPVCNYTAYPEKFNWIPGFWSKKGAEELAKERGKISGALVMSDIMSFDPVMLEEILQGGVWKDDLV
jgi:hypothetical protein